MHYVRDPKKRGRHLNMTPKKINGHLSRNHQRLSQKGLYKLSCWGIRVLNLHSEAQFSQRFFKFFLIEDSNMDNVKSVLIICLVLGLCLGQTSANFKSCYRGCYIPCILLPRRTSFYCSIKYMNKCLRPLSHSLLCGFLLGDVYQANVASLMRIGIFFELVHSGIMWSMSWKESYAINEI
ncbi:hypothetical protein BT93_E0434 [Corymbia citriodora subsp. variegata]|nr:hypothetical protein BT93_E0434 [Corymbia citriodora subsp. variegata]